MIENIGSNSNDLVTLTRNLLKKTEIQEKKPDVIEDSHVPPKEEEKYATYNKNGALAKNHVILPDRYNEKNLPGYIYYKGERISQLELLEKAVDTGAIELDEEASVFSNYERAWVELIESKAKPLYEWSTSLYSEDGMYKFRVENGQITGAALARNNDGNCYVDIAKALASGILPTEMNTDVFGLAHLDPELYQAACQIGNAKRTYDDAADKSLFNILFGFNVDDVLKDFATIALENFNQNRYNNWFQKYYS